MPGIWNSFRVMAKIMLVTRIPKSTRVNFVRKFVFASMGNLIKIIYSITENFKAVSFSGEWLTLADKLFFF